MPFGLRNADQSLQKVYRRCTTYFLAEFCFDYIDDTLTLILVYSSVEQYAFKAPSNSRLFFNQIVQSNGVCFKTTHALAHWLVLQVLLLHATSVVHIFCVENLTHELTRAVT